MNYGNWDKPKARSPKPLVLSARDWDWEARTIERLAQHHFTNVFYFELAAKFAHYVLRCLWSDGACRVRRTATFEVFAKRDEQRLYCLGKEVVKLQHHPTDPTNARERIKVKFGQAGVFFGRKMDRHLLAGEDQVRAKYERQRKAVEARARREQRLVERAPDIFDELEKLAE